jgi:hypothetical protein
MQIDDDVDRSEYKYKPSKGAMTHPEFGVDSIKDTKMKIDILVDKKECKRIGGKPDYFREVEPSIWQKLF